MSKNMTHKGLAIGAGVALASSALVGLPANAAVSSITLAPLSGTSTGGVIDLGYVLKATVAGATTNTIAFAISGYDTATDVQTDQYVAASVPATTTGADVDDANELDALADAAAGDENADDQVIKSVTAATATPYALLGLTLDADDVDEATTLTVFAFEDTNGDGLYDADLGEKKSNSVTVTFTPQDEVAVTASMTHDTNAPGTTDVTVAMTGVNMASMIGATTGAKLADQLVYKNGASAVALAADPITAADYDADENAFVNAALASTAAAGAVMTADIHVGAETDATRTIRTDLGASDVASYDAIKISSTQPYILASGANFKARSGDGAFTATMVVKDADGDELAGETVTWVIEESAVDHFNAKAKITAGGKTLTNASATKKDKISPTSVTDADGKASITISYADLKNAEVFNLSASVASSSIAAAAAKTVTATDSAAYDVEIYNADDSGAALVTLGGSYTLKVALRDEYGLAPATKSRVKLTVTGGQIANTAFVEFAANVGTSTMTFTDNSAAAGSLTVAFADVNAANADATVADADTTNEKLDFVDADGDWGGEVLDAGVTLAGNTTLTVKKAATIKAATKLAFDTAASHDIDVANEQAPLWGQDVFSADSRLQTNDDFDTALAALALAANPAGGTENNTAKVKLTDVNGLAVVGGNSVTFSAPSVQFYDKANEIWGYESITVQAETDGTATVNFASNVSGEHTITATSGSLSDTLVVDVADPATSAGKSWVVTAPATVSPAATWIVDATLVDKYGNAVKDTTASAVSAEWSGPGLVVGSLPTALSSSGTLRIAILMGANDSGSHTLTLTHGGADSDLTTKTGANANISSVSTVLIGDAPVEQKVNAGSFKGYVAVYARGYEGKRLSAKVGKDWVVVPSIVNNQENGTLFRVVEFTGAGYDVAVRIYIDRVLVDTINLTTK